MAIVLPHIQPGFTTICLAINSCRLPSVGANFHLDASEVTVTAATATDLPTSQALMNNVAGVLAFHFGDLVAHKAVTANVLPGTQDANASLAAAITAYTTAKTAYTAHIASTGAHYTADATNTLTSTAPTDLPSLIIALNEFKTKLNTHMTSAPAGQGIRLTPQ